MSLTCDECGADGEVDGILGVGGGVLRVVSCPDCQNEWKDKR